MEDDFNSEFELSYGLSSYECSVLLNDRFKLFKKLVERLEPEIYPTENLKSIVCDSNVPKLLDLVKKRLNDFETMFRTVNQRYSEIENTYLKELDQRIAARKQKKDTV